MAAIEIRRILHLQRVEPASLVFLCHHRGEPRATAY
jgi:hypothetical protein